MRLGKLMAVALVAGALLVPAPPRTRLGHEALTSVEATIAKTRPCLRKSLNAGARELARTALTTAETYSTDHEGAYTGLSPAALHAEANWVPVNRRQSREWNGAYLKRAAGTTDSYRLTVRAHNGNTFSIFRQSTGAIARTARVCGSWRHW